MQRTTIPEIADATRLVTRHAEVILVPGEVGLTRDANVNGVGDVVLRVVAPSIVT
jgi:hypothetical protein